MTLPEENAKRLIELLSSAWDGRLSAADNEEIDAFLRAHGQEGAETLLKVTSVHLELNKHVSSIELFERVMADINDAATSDVGDAQAAPALALESKVPPIAWKQWAASVIAATLFLAVGYQVLFWEAAEKHNPAAVSRTARLLRPYRPVATVTVSTDAVWASGSEVKVGQTIDENQRLELLSGTAQVSMAKGADIVLQAPCSVTLVTDDFVRLESGKLTAQAAKWATGFVVAANDLKVTDLGTRFALSAAEDGVVEAHVLEGSVLAEPLKERRRQQSSMLLKSGQAIRVDGVRAKVDLIDTRRDEFVNEIERFQPLRPIEIWNTGVGGKAGSSDPYWRIIAGAEEFGPYPRPATIADGDTGSYEDNRPDVSQWVSVSAESYPGVPPKSTHTFETTFDLTGYDLETVRLIGYFLVDDAIDELLINGKPIEYERWETTWDVFDFKSFHPIEITEHFVLGENVVSIKVYNSPSRPENPNAYNPSALRVEWQAFGCLLASESE